MDREYQADFDEDERRASGAPRLRVAREMAIAMLKRNGITTPPVPVEGCVTKEGLRLVRVEVDGRLSGQLYASEKEVVVNTKGRPVTRQRFTMAHELGHWVLRHYEGDARLIDSVGFDGGYASDDTKETRNPIEVEANTFAAELLMPSAWLKLLKRPLASDAPDTLAAQYQVSREAMFYQLMRCKLI